MYLSNCYPWDWEVWGGAWRLEIFLWEENEWKMKHLGQNGHQRQKGQIVHFVFEKECQWRAYFGVCKYVQRNVRLPHMISPRQICIFRFHVKRLYDTCLTFLIGGISFFTCIAQDTVLFWVPHTSLFLWPFPCICSGGVKSVLLNYGQTQVPFFVRQSRFKRYLGACPAILVRQRRKWLAPWCGSAGHVKQELVHKDT